MLDHKAQVEAAAKQFANFTYTLKDFDSNRLTDTLVQFHDLNFRYQQFSEAIQHGNAHRIEQSQEEIKLLLSLKNYVDTYNNYIHHKDVKKRVTHHDTKISNVLFDQDENPLCIIDLDTVMPGSALSDFGDAMRTIGNYAPEDEPNLNNIKFNEDLFKAFSQGYLSEAMSFLLPSHI